MNLNGRSEAAMSITSRPTSTPCRTRRRGVIENTAPSVDPRIQRRLEQVLSAQPTGLPWPLLRDAVISRFGRDEGPSGEDVLRVLGTLIVAGRVDQSDGRIVIRAY
jgi:hypothetical protein